MKKIASLILAVAILVTTFAGCGSSKGNASAAASTEKKKITFAVATDITTLDPRNAAGTSTAMVLLHMFNALTKTDANGKVVGDLAESYKSVNDTTWEFKLKKGVTFQNGEVFNAKAVKYTVDTLQDPKSKFKIAADFSFIKEIKIVDDYTIQLITKKPYSGTPLRLTYLMIIPPEYTKKIGDKEFAKKPVGTGSYKFVERVKDQKVVMEAYDKYFGGKPKIDTVTFKCIPEDASRVSALQSGEVDIISAVPTSQMDLLKANSKITVVAKPTSRVIYVGMNTTIDSPLKNVKVRQAINYAVDKNSIIKDVLNGNGSILANISTPQYAGYDSTLKPYEYNPTKAKQLLTEAGFPNGFSITMDTTTGYLNGNDVMQAVSAQLKKVGITVKLVEKDSSLLREEMASHKTDPLFINGIGGPYADLELIGRIGFGTGERYSTYSNKANDALRTKASQTIDATTANKEWSQYQQAIQSDAAALFMYQQHGIYAYNKKVLNWEPRIDEMIKVDQADIQN